MRNRIQDLNIFVVFIIIVYSILVQSFLERTINNLALSYFVNFLTSVGFYKTILSLIYTFINQSDFFIKLYWNKLYLKGLWSYTYSLNDKKYRGIWRIDQDLYSIRVTGFGLDDNDKPRSDVRSVTNLIERTQSYEIINIRKDRVKVNQENYSKTTLYPDFNPRNHLFHIPYPIRMRATTVIYGGELSGIIHEDVVFIKHETAKSEEEVIHILLEDNYDR
jgi:hypothetical protein